MPFSDFTLSRDDDRNRPASRNIARHIKMNARFLHYYSAVLFYQHYAIVFICLAGSRSCLYRYAPSANTCFAAIAGETAMTTVMQLTQKITRPHLAQALPEMPWSRAGGMSRPRLFKGVAEISQKRQRDQENADQRLKAGRLRTQPVARKVYSCGLSRLIQVPIFISCQPT